MSPPRPRPEFAPTDSAAAFAALAVMVALFAVLLTRADGWVPLLDSANLAFHEAGHVFFGVFGATFGLYGGTLGQLVLPTVVAVKFARDGHAVGAAAGVVWFGENLLNIARYAQDARAQLLPLVGGGEHDWANILTRWNALHHELAVARVIRLLGWAAMLGAFGWLLWRYAAAVRASRSP